MTRHVGFTGTRQGMTAAQKETLQREFLSLDYSLDEWWFHHGDCVGSDEQADRIARAHGAKIWMHPPKNPVYRAYIGLDARKDKIVPELPYIERNKKIVECAQRMIATPDGAEKIRSGTWSTIRYAKRLNKDLVVIMPDGSID